MQSCYPCMGGEPSLGHLFQPGGSSDLLWCTSHQLAQGVIPPPAATTGILWTGFSTRPLSLRWSEAATNHCHTSIRGKRLMVKWAECEIHSEKASSMCVQTACVASCPRPDGPACRKRTGKQYPGHLLAHVPAP